MTDMATPHDRLHQDIVCHTSQLLHPAPVCLIQIVKDKIPSQQLLWLWNILHMGSTMSKSFVDMNLQDENEDEIPHECQAHSKVVHRVS